MICSVRDGVVPLAGVAGVAGVAVVALVVELVIVRVVIDADAVVDGDDVDIDIVATDVALGV
eukprot:11394218-Alexandrium_andersonii.AAC.1